MEPFGFPRDVSATNFSESHNPADLRYDHQIDDSVAYPKAAGPDLVLLSGYFCLLRQKWRESEDQGTTGEKHG
jgi:hypothetical protein